MKLRFLLLFVLSTINIFSQQKERVTFDWKVEEEPVSKVKYWNSDGVFHQDFLLPVYLKQWKKEVGGEITGFKVTNIVEKTLNTSHLSKVQISELKSEFLPVFKIVKERNVEFYSIEAYPIYVKSGKIIQIQSFDLEYSISSKARASKVNKQSVVVNSVLNSGTWYKIAVDKTGVFKMDASFLRSLGIDVSNLDPQKIRVFGNGGGILPELLNQPRKEDLVESAIVVKGEEDGVFNSDDYVLFYAQGPVSWSLDSRNSIRHKQNIYSEFGYYFINVDSAINGKRIQAKASVTNGVTKSINTFTDYQLHEKELTNYIRVGRQWFGEDFTVENEQVFDFNFPNIDVSKQASVTVAFSAVSRSVATKFSVVYDNNDGDETNDDLILESFISRVFSAQQFQTGMRQASFSPEKEELKFNVSWSNNGDLSANAKLDYIEVVTDRFLVPTSKQFQFLNFNSNTTGEVLEYTITEDDKFDFIWDVTNDNQPELMVNMSEALNEFKFRELTNGTLNKYHLVTLSDVYEPIKLQGSSVVANQNLHSLKDIHYAIITKKEFIPQANRIKEYHEKNTFISDSNTETINVEVVDVEQIYNEFGSGASDITAIRDFIKFLYDNASSEENKIKYVCMFGDANFDYKNITYKTPNIVPVYLSTLSNSLTNSYNTDDYYGYLDEGDDTVDDGELSPSAKLDVTTGRVPVGTTLLAKQFVDKLINYYSTNSFGNWKNRVTLLGDDGQHGDDQGLIKFLEESAVKMEKNNKNLNLVKLYTDAFKEEVTSGGGTYPSITKRFHESFDNGALVINYFGHGNVFGLGQERFLDLQNIRSFRNKNSLPLFITVTCDFSRFDDPTITSGGEELVHSPLGGVASMITTSREISIISGNQINKGLADYLFSFDGKTRTAAEALKDAKNEIFTSNEFFVYFFGDPAMKLSLPQEGIEIDKVYKHVKTGGAEETSLVQVTELNGLSKLRVEGQIVQKDSVPNGTGGYDVTKTPLSDFNGELFVTLYGKEIERKTLLNEAKSSGKTPNPNNVVNFSSLENKVFVGNATIREGKFSFDFVLPKDVNVIPEEAKFSMYAKSSSSEKIGSEFNYKIGGIDPEAEEDTTPPEINLFLNEDTFIDGGTTDPTPLLIARLGDENGINTSLNSIGHNISLVIDGNFANPVSLNEFYTTDKDDFTKGNVNYQMPELSEGNHTITFKAWDSHNNSATQTLNFTVRQDAKFKISKVLNYPNPFVNYTEFWFKNNRKGDPLEVKLQVFTVSGKLIKTIIASDNNTEDIIKIANWNGEDDFGNRLGKGVYLYKLTVKEIISGQTDQKIEKLVIL